MEFGLQEIRDFTQRTMFRGYCIGVRHVCELLEDELERREIVEAPLILKRINDEIGCLVDELRQSFNISGESPNDSSGG